MADQKLVYLDNAATTRVDPEVLEEMLPYFCDKYGNAASQYYELGRQARAALDQARERLARLLNAAPGEIFFTAGATEADNWVLQGTALGGKKKHIVTSAIEHHAILEPLEWLKKHGYADYTVLPVDRRGRVDPDDLRKAIRGDTGLVTIMHTNNEIGTMQPIPELAAVAREAGVPFHTDATQSVGKIAVDVQALGVDSLSLSAHKFHGPKGIGALYLKKGTRIAPLLHGGGQENNRRAGTSNVGGAVGLGKAAELADRYIADGPRQAALVEKIWTGLSGAIRKIERNGDPERRIPNLLSVCVEGAEGEAVLGYMDMLYGLQVSSGSACTSGSLDPSHVLLACGVPVEKAHGSIRVSLSHWTTEEDADLVVKGMPDVVARIRSMSVTWKDE